MMLTIPAASRSLPPHPAPHETEDLNDQLRYAVILLEDCLMVSEG